MKFAQLVLLASLFFNPLPGLVTAALAVQLPGPPLSGSLEEHADLVQEENAKERKELIDVSE